MDQVVGIDQQRVGSWLDRHIAGARGPYQYTVIAGGRSNLTYAVDDAAGTRYVLRRPPTGHVLATAHDMGREYRLIAAVGATGVPVPRALGLCEDHTVNGAPFYVMSFVDGVVLDSVERGGQLAMGVRAAAGRDLIDVLAALHDVDIDAVGLGDLAKREDYVGRQLRRWTAQWEQTRTDDLEVIERVGAHLRANIPVQQGATIVHGDYRFGNCLTDPVTGRINAILDWELCTLGDPLADLGYLGVYWQDSGSATLAANDANGAGGFGDYRELVERYAGRTGRDVSGLDYYVAFSCWRLAVISQGVYARFLHGAMGDQAIDLDNARRTVELLAERAAETLHI
jgi:aminoglycoside phosphotransferase (APT) family kinase protein